MMQEEIENLYIRIAFQHESILDRLISKRLIGQDLADRARKTFYDTVNETKLRTFQKIKNQAEINTPLYERHDLWRYGGVDKNSEAI